VDGHKNNKMEILTKGKINIENLSKERYKYIEERNESWEEEAGHYTIEENPKVDELGEQIFDKIKTERKILSFEFIIEELTKLGQAPCLLYDDDGHFAISEEGIQTISTNGKDNRELYHFIEERMWQDSIREALNYYLDN
jgi:hypothetical protein